MKPKRYSSAQKLGQAWLARSIQGEAVSGRVGAYRMTADPDHIWSGEKTFPLVRRHKTLPLVIALRHGSHSLGKAALAAIKYASEVPEIAKYRFNYNTKESYKETTQARQVPVPVTCLNDLRDDHLSSCDLATLQPLVLASCIPTLKCLVTGYRHNSPGHYRYTNLEREWENERDFLKAVGLDIPEEYEKKKLVAVATRRLKTGVHHE
jgi:hypothetical protein